MANVIHHTAICVSDMDASVRFYRDGLGMEPTVAGDFEGPWRQLFGGPVDKLTMTMLGAADSPRAGTIELLQFVDAELDVAPPPSPRNGFLLISVYCDVDVVLGRLAELGHPDHERIELETPHGTLVMGSVRDPDGTLIELIDDTIGAQVTG